MYLPHESVDSSTKIHTQFPPMSDRIESRIEACSEGENINTTPTSPKTACLTPSQDQRVRHTSRPHKIKDEDKEEIRKHIGSFPKYRSRYSRSRTPNKTYISSVYSIQEMFNFILVYMFRRIMGHPQGIQVRSARLAAKPGGPAVGGHALYLFLLHYGAQHVSPLTLYPFQRVLTTTALRHHAWIRITECALLRVLMRKEFSHDISASAWDKCSTQHHDEFGKIKTSPLLFYSKSDGTEQETEYDGVPPHFDRRVRNYLNATFPDRWQGWAGTVATSITGLNPTGFLLWGDMKRLVYKTSIDTAEDLVARVVEAAHVIRDNVGLFERCRHSTVRRYQLCNVFNGRQFQHHL
ncbi:hypothetical protein ANN_18497 [Periplaneta americana]|uniref:Uncharacterized protein n=1 Tax=Periplaneta americana TaxID=6978 RepID=A0ABQ8SQE0_PERAM|nr:hypothetical protein ANN_18497 [Periplaneta americana]